jgi:hypothetical protein
VLGDPDRCDVEMPELIGPLDAEESRSAAAPLAAATLHQAVLAHEPLHALAVDPIAELAAGERGDHPGLVARVGARDRQHQPIDPVQRPALTRRWALRPAVDRLPADPRHASDDRGGTALRDELAGPGHALSHSQPRKSSPAISTSIVFPPSARSRRAT